LSLSPLVASIEPSKTIEVHALTQAMKAEGNEVLSLAVGEPDFGPPAPILEATLKAINDGQTRYTAVSGTAPLRAAIGAHLEARKGTPYAPDEVVVCNGAKQALFQAVLTTCRPGDEVIIPAPYWPSYPEMVKFAGATPVVLETTVTDGYLIQPEALRAAVTPRTRMLIFCNPSNPTGAVHDTAAVAALAEVLDTHPNGGQVWVLSDEIYERLTYDGVQHGAFAAARATSGNSMWPRTLTVNGFSKVKCCVPSL